METNSELISLQDLAKFNFKDGDTLFFNTDAVDAKSLMRLPALAKVALVPVFPRFERTVSDELAVGRKEDLDALSNS